MFIYLSKKIAIPNNTKLNTVAWNKENGYIAVGGEDGLLKVLKLDGGNSTDSIGKSRGLAAASNLSMNQTLEGHTDNIKVITWNEMHKKLTTSDQNGVIIVWMLYKGAWYEEMINNRKKSTVVGMAWSSDGLKICIIYEDGAVIVGSVDGNRIWGKELKNVQLSAVQWSPDGKLLIFGLYNGQVHVYDNLGNFAMKLEILCLEPMNEEPRIIGMDWYDGKYGYMHALCPALAICYENGRMQLMCSENDINPIIVDTNMLAVSSHWNHNGSLLAVAGRQFDQDRYVNIVQFYSPLGDHLRTLKVPGLSITCCVWEGGSLRVALAVDSYVYFANLRPDYKWCYFKRTVVFTSCRPQKAGICVSFWDTSNNQCHIKYVPVLAAIAGYGDYCCLVTCSNDEKNSNSRKPYQHSLLLCNTLGTPVDTICVDIDVQWVCMNSTHVIAASRNNFVIWQYKIPKYTATSFPGGLRNRIRLYHIDDNPSGAVEVIQDLDEKIDVAVSTFSSTDPICCLAASNKVLIVGRESGLLQHYALPHVALYNRNKLSTRPHKMAINCNSTRLSVIDVAGVLSVIDVSEGVGRPNGSTADEKLERKDVWAMCWATDNPQLLAIMEKTRMYIFKGANPEEPIASSGYVCNFQDLEVQALLLDDIMETPEKPSKDRLINLEVKSLRDTRQLLEKVGIKEAAQFIEDNPHPRLWRLLAEAALKNMDIETAESAFIRSNNFAGIAFVKKLSSITDESARKAYVSIYFKDYDEAEKLYFEADRRDLALTMRQTLGDWFRVIQIMKNGVSAPDHVLEAAYNAIADYFAQFNNWSAAVEYYELAKNRSQMVECYYNLEDYEGIRRLVEESEDGDPLLKQIGDLYTADGNYNLAVDAYSRFGDYKAAVDVCVRHNRWDYAKELSQKYDIPEIYKLFSNTCVGLVDQKLLLAREESKKKLKDCKMLKQMFVYGARLYEEHLRRNASTHETTENIWDGALAHHLYLLAHEQLYNGKIHQSMQIAFQLLDYQEYIEPRDIYSLLALTSFLDGAYRICSTAFTQFRNLEGVSDKEADQYDELAAEIFEKYVAEDKPGPTVLCGHCRESIPDWSTTCPYCYTRFPICIVSGRSIVDNSIPWWSCPECHHHSLRNEIMHHTTCPLCHIDTTVYANFSSI